MRVSMAPAALPRQRMGVARGTAHSLSLRTNFVWTFIGNGVYAACQWGMLVVLAKLGTPATVGTFALALAVTAPVLMFTNLQLRGVQATDARREYTFADYLALRLIATALALLVIVAIVLAAGYPRQTAFIILLVGLAKCCEAISDVFYGLLQQRERMDRIAISMMVKGVLSLLVLGGAMFVTHSVVWASAGLALTWAAVLAGYDVRSGALILRGARQYSGTVTRLDREDQLRPHWSLRTLTRLTWLALPLGIVMMLISLNTNIPRYFVERELGARDLGFFAAMAYLMVAGTMVVFALGQAASPRLSRYYAAGNRRAFRALLLKTVWCGVALGLVGVAMALIAGHWILSHLYRPEYATHVDVFIWLMVAAGISYAASFLGYGMTAARYFRLQTPLFLLVSGVTAAACYLLVPREHLLGAAYALVIAGIVQLAGSAAVVGWALRSAPKRAEA